MSLTSYRAAPPRDQGWSICQASISKASFTFQRDAGPNWGEGESCEEREGLSSEAPAKEDWQRSSFVNRNS
jgi:hypothetical protein